MGKRRSTALKQDAQKLTDAAPFLEILRSASLDGKLAAAVRASPPTLPTIGLQAASIDEYLAIASKWYSFWCSKRKSAAQKVVSSYGLTLNSQNAQRLKTFLTGLRARLILHRILSQASEEGPARLRLIYAPVAGRQSFHKR